MGVLVTITPPEPEALVKLQEAKDQLRVLTNDEDELILGYIEAASAWIDGYQGWVGQCFAPQVLELRSNVFAGIGRLPIGPVTQIESLKYIDGAGVEQTVEAGLYTHFTDRLDLVPGARWPQLRGDAGGVRLRFKAGHDRIPPPVKQAALLLVGQWYRHRMAINVGNIVNEMPNGVKALLGPYRVIRV